MLKSISDRIILGFEDVIEEMRNVVVNNYTKITDGIDSGSVLKSSSIINGIIDRLRKFDYIVKSKDQIKLTTPDKHNFNFVGDLSILNVLHEGIVGYYTEIKISDYNRVISETRMLKGNYSNDLSMPVVLIKTSSTIPLIERFLKKKLVEYPFSNTGPIDIFYNVDDIVKNRMHKIIDTSIVNSIDTISKGD